MKDKTIDYVLRTTWLAVQKMYNEEASEYGITMATGFTLLSVDPQNGTPSTSLGPKMGMEATSLSRILKTLEDLSLIERLPNPNDGRGVRRRMGRILQRPSIPRDEEPREDQRSKDHEESWKG